MDYKILLLLLIGHFIGDYYLQTDEIAKNKNKNTSQLIKHCLLYTVAMLIVIIPVFSLEILTVSIAISLIHFIVDFIKSKTKKIENRESKIYLLDQLIHILIIIGFSIFISLNLRVNYIIPIKNFFSLININDLKVLSTILTVIIIMKPASISIKIILSKYGTFTDDEKEGFPNTGALIGQLERFIILLMLTQGQYAAIGFILTAKSVARYKKIVDEAKFSEYYLLGTFLSTFIVIVTYLLVFKPFNS